MITSMIYINIEVDDYNVHRVDKLFTNWMAEGMWLIRRCGCVYRRHSSREGRREVN